MYTYNEFIKDKLQRHQQKWWQIYFLSIVKTLKLHPLNKGENQ